LSEGSRSIQSDSLSVLIHVLACESITVYWLLMGWCVDGIIQCWGLRTVRGWRQILRKRSGWVRGQNHVWCGVGRD